MPFNQQMTIPVELSLRTAEGGVKMFAEPVRELKSRRQTEHAWKQLAVESGEKALEGVTGDLFDITADIEPATAKRVGLIVRGVPVIYDATKQELTCRDITAPLALAGGGIRLRILVDRGSLEVFGNDGCVALSVGVIPPEENRSIRLTAEDGAATFRSLELHELSSAWK
jgi:sucrose-6-phosphate hydrolase SacC (GH32 family)